MTSTARCAVSSPGRRRSRRPGRMIGSAMSGSTLDRLLAGGPRLTVGMITADLAHLGDEMAVLEAAGVELVHVDVMDGVFCPMLTVGPPIVGGDPEPHPQGRPPHDRRPADKARRVRRGRRRPHHVPHRRRPPAAPGPPGPRDGQQRQRPGAGNRPWDRDQPEHAGRRHRAAPRRGRLRPRPGRQPGLGRAAVHRRDGPAPGRGPSAHRGDRAPDPPRRRRRGQPRATSPGWPGWAPT